MKLEELISNLVKIESYSGNEKNISKFIEHYLENKKVKHTRLGNDIIVHITNGSKKAIIVNAHIDTVKLQERESWGTNPFKLSKEKDKYYGLGVSDEKISVAILLDMINSIKAKKTDIFLIFVTKEEIDGSGSIRFIDFFKKKFNYKKNLCIICEPTNSNYIELGNKGSIFFKIITLGKSSHASKPNHGINSIDIMIKKIKEINKEFKFYSKTCKKLGPATIAFPTRIIGGKSINTIPENCIAFGDIRTNRLCHKELIKFLKNKGEVISEAEPYLFRSSKNFVKMFRDLGINKKRYSSGSNDSIFFWKDKIPCITFGAGNKEAIHKPNEFIEIKNIKKTRQIYLNLIEKYNNTL